MSVGEEIPSFVAVLRDRARRQPERKAYSYLHNGDREQGHLTYGDLDRHARAIASELLGLGAKGSRALLLYPPGLEFIKTFFGCLYAGVVAIPVPLVRRSLPRLQALAEDAEASFALTDSRNSSYLQDAGSQLPGRFRAMEWLVTDEVTPERAAEWREPVIGCDSLAYLQYTSGSTSAPKGVMVTHGNLLRHCALIKQAWGYTEDSVSATWVPHFHDYGLVDGILQPMYVGIPCYVMSPVAFYMRPIRLLKTVSRHRVTHTQGPDFSYAHCVRKIRSEQLAGLDLTSWRTASDGGEPVRRDTVESFAATFGPHGFRRDAFYPAYGLAEATLLVATKRHGQTPVVGTFDAEALGRNVVVEVAAERSVDARTLVSCGPPIGGMKVVIAHPEARTECEPLTVGEIWVSDASLAVGYWRNTAETERTFGARLADSGEGPFMRTGDMGFLKDGELYVTGRLKDVIIIRGRNHYPQDIELSVEKSHAALRPGYGAAFGVDHEEREGLVVVHEVERHRLRNLVVDEVVADIRQAIADEHELQLLAVVLVRPGSVPRTSSGKVQRSACRTRFLEDTLEHVESLDPGAEVGRGPRSSSADGQRGAYANDVVSIDME